MSDDSDVPRSGEAPLVNVFCRIAALPQSTARRPSANLLRSRCGHAVATARHKSPSLDGIASIYNPCSSASSMLPFNMRYPIHDNLITAFLQESRAIGLGLLPFGTLPFGTLALGRPPSGLPHFGLLPFSELADCGE